MNQEAPTLRTPQPEEAPRLTALALRSKASWGYPEGFMQACEDELTVLPEHIESAANHFEVAQLAGAVVGFYLLEGQVGDQIELGALFVEPDRMGRGIGRLLLEGALSRARSLGAIKMTIQGDPHADGFYRSAGAMRVGSRESGSIPGRMLPMYRMYTDPRRSGPGFSR